MMTNSAYLALENQIISFLAEASRLIGPLKDMESVKIQLCELANKINDLCPTQEERDRVLGALKDLSNRSDDVLDGRAIAIASTLFALLPFIWSMPFLSDVALGSATHLCTPDLLSAFI